MGTPKKKNGNLSQLSKGKWPRDYDGALIPESQKAVEKKKAREIQAMKKKQKAAINARKAADKKRAEMDAFVKKIEGLGSPKKEQRGSPTPGATTRRSSYTYIPKK
jgi:hypothetical protein